LHALTRAGIKEVHGDQEGRALYPNSSFISKTQLATGGLGALKEVFVPVLQTDEEGDKLLCPVRCLDEYLKRSDTYRSPSQKLLFIPWQHGYSKDVGTQTISGYIKAAVMLAYTNSDMEDYPQVVPHTVRHVATSLRAVRHFSLQDVLGAGRWTSPNTFISHYLHNYSTDTLSGLSGLGGFVAGGAKF